MFHLSVIICSHNPRAAYLSRVLQSLHDQTLPQTQWELILVDNASTRPLAGCWDLSWHPHARHILEEELGVTAARQRGARESLSDLVVFVDDDNVLDKTYLMRVIKVKKEWPLLGVWGSGSIIPEYEMVPEDHVKDLLPCLALRESETACWSNVYPCVDATPWGAGMCVRATVADAYCRLYRDSTILISSRRGNSLFSGEDVEMAYVACRLGLGMAVFPELRLTHLIPRERVSKQYLLKLFEGTETSNALIAYKWSGRLPTPIYNPRVLLGILKNLTTRTGIDRRIYVAKIRALVVARRIIRASEMERGRKH